MLHNLRLLLQSLGLLLVLAVVAFVFDRSVDDARPLIISTAAAVAVAALAHLQRPNPRLRDGWLYLTPSVMEWFALIGCFAFTALLLWIYYFVGSARADAATQMMVLKWLIAAFAVGTGTVFFTSFASELRWNDDQIEQRRPFLLAKTIRFADIVTGGTNPLTHTVWIAASDGTVIRFSHYSNGAEALARTIFQPEHDAPTL
jgi:hypothetical protein